MASCQNSGLSMEETFTKIYATDAWGKGSGAGSVPVHCLKWLLGVCATQRSHLTVVRGLKRSQAR